MPILNDRNGDLSKQWYVEFAYRKDKHGSLVRQRIYSGLSSGTAKERYETAQKIIDEQTRWCVLCPTTPPKQNENELSTLVQAYIDIMPNYLKKKSVSTYKGKLYHFVDYIKETDITKISKAHIIDYSIFLSKNELARITISRSIRVLKAFFEWAIEKNFYFAENPAINIKKTGIIKDCAPLPITLADRKTLKDYIEKHNPQLWLACEIIYYCAVRPGCELRLMKIADIDFDNCILRIPAYNAKNASTETIKCPPFIIEKMKLLKYNLFAPDFYVFGKCGKPSTVPCSANILSRKFIQARDALNLPKGYKFYSWKHSGIISALQNGMQPFDVQQHCRHKEFATTEKYIKKMTKLPKDFSHFFGEI